MAGYKPRKCRNCSTWYQPTSARQYQCAPCGEIAHAEWWGAHGYPERAEQLPALRAAQQKRRREAAKPVFVENLDEDHVKELKARITAWEKQNPARAAATKAQIASDLYARCGIGAPLCWDHIYREILVKMGEVPPVPVRG